MLITHDVRCIDLVVVKLMMLCPVSAAQDMPGLLEGQACPVQLEDPKEVQHRPGYTGVQQKR